jgi:hypothetical protein
MTTVSKANGVSTSLRIDESARVLLVVPTLAVSVGLGVNVGRSLIGAMLNLTVAAPV